MKGFTKAIKRTPHLVTTKVGMSKKSLDPEFDDYQRRFALLESSTEKLIKDTKAFMDGVNHLFTAGASFANHFSTVFHPIAGEYDLLGKHPECADTVKNMDAYQQANEELRSAVAPELELIESRIVGPSKEFQGVLKTVRKTITKREHKLMDYDRFNNSLTKLRDKKEKSLSDEKNLFKLEQDFEAATTEYDFINTALKNDLPRFMMMATQFIDPLFHSFFYMQLNIYYLLLEKMQGFTEGKYDISVAPAQIAEEYEGKRSDAWQTIENMSITQRIVSTSKMVQQNRSNGGLSPNPNLNRSASATSSMSGASRTMPPSRAASTAGFKKAPLPPPSKAAEAAPPPPYTPPSQGVAAAAATKRAPPPPPALKPKPKLEPPVQYVVALYDFEAQADGDLSFNAGDRIELVERTQNQEDWWTGRVHGNQGVFPGNYVQEA